MVQDSAIPCNTMQYHAIPCKTKQNQAKPCHTMQYNAITCNTMRYHAIQWNTMQYHAIPCDTMQYNALLITADGAYHCPVGSIMAIFDQLRRKSDFTMSSSCCLLIWPRSLLYKS